MCLRYELDAIKILEIQTVPLIETGRLIGTIRTGLLIEQDA